MRVDEPGEDELAVGLDGPGRLKVRCDAVPWTNLDDRVSVDRDRTIGDYPPIRRSADDGPSEDEEVHAPHQWVPSGEEALSPARIGPTKLAISASTPANFSTVAATYAWPFSAVAFRGLPSTPIADRSAVSHEKPT